MKAPVSMPEVIQGTASQRETFAWSAALVATAAFASGLAQDIILAKRLWIDDTIIFLSRDFLWMGPTGYLLVFAALYPFLFGATALLSILRSPELGRRAFAFAFTFLAALALLLLFPSLHVVAQVLLALGVAAR